VPGRSFFKAFGTDVWTKPKSGPSGQIRGHQAGVIAATFFRVLLNAGERSVVGQDRQNSYVDGPRVQVFEAVWAFWSGAVICPALSRGVWPLALMEFAGRVPIE
jgi:hypothetical protein